MLGWMKLRLESRLPGEILITSDMQLIPPLWQKVKNYKSLLVKVKDLAKTQHSQKTKIMASGPITSWQINGETVTDFILGAPKSLR